MSQPQVDDLTRGDWVEPASEARFVTPERRVTTSCRSELESETRDLLHARIRAASVIMAIGFSLFLIHGLFFASHSRSPILVYTILAVLLILNVWALTSRWKPTLRQLRVLEVATFGSILVCLIATQTYRFRFQTVQTMPSAQELRLVFKNSIIGTLLLILTYGIFIPNHWRRASRIIIPMALTPLVAPILLGLTSHAFRELARNAWTLERITENGLSLALGAAVAIFGVYTINGFRSVGFQAKWLNKYHLTRRLGAGGMGEVYLAEHELLKRPCAIKLIRPSLSNKPRVLARFEREAQATAKLSHWNTIEIYDYGRTADGTFYYVMEYLPGLSLQGLVERHGSLPPGRVIYLLRQACGALFEAHEVGFIHRDLKPPNIFAAYRGARYDVVKVLDFGLVKATKEDDSPSLTREGVVTGSPLYMAPEQITRSRVPDPRTDLYALGAIGYFLLTGRPPFTGADSMAVMVAHARDPVPPPSKLNPEVPGDLEAVILRCLAKEPERRFQNAKLLSTALASCADATSWSEERAREWWCSHEPELINEAIAGEPTEPVDSVAVGTAPLVREETLDGGEVEVAESLEKDIDRLSPAPGANPDEPEPAR